MLNTRFSPWPSFTCKEAEAIQRVLLSNRVNYWTGNECRSFETEFKNWIGCEYAVAMANGTLALDAALKGIGVKEGDEIVVTSRTFIASVSSIIIAGARPVFADIDQESQNITAQSIASVLTKNTRAIICVHFAGWPCDMEPIMKLARERDIYVIEDCAQAHGAKYKGTSVGNIGDCAAWSFCQDKIMTTGGEGGMITTNNSKIWNKIWSYKDHGKSYEAVYKRKHPPGFRWVHESFGTNFRMTEIQGVIGRIQLSQMSDWTLSRSKNANEIMNTCKKFPSLYRVPVLPRNIVHAWYKCYVFLRDEILASKRLTRDGIIEEFNSLGIPCYQGGCSEVYLEKAFDITDFKPKKPLKAAKALGKTSLMFLVHPTLKPLEVEKTCNVIELVSEKILQIK